MLKTKASSGFIIVISSTNLASMVKSASAHSQTSPAPTESLLTLGLVALIYFPFSPQCHIFLKQIHRQVHFLVMPLISCVKLYKSLMLSEFWFSHEKSEGHSVCFTELLWESRYFYLKSLIYLPQLGLASPMCTLPLSPSYIKILIINHTFIRIHRTYICFPINELPINRYKQGPSRYFSYV